MKTYLKQLIEAIYRWRQQRELEQELSRLDPRMLKDIGLETWRRPWA